MRIIELLEKRGEKEAHVVVTSDATCIRPRSPFSFTISNWWAPDRTRDLFTALHRRARKAGRPGGEESRQMAGEAVAARGPAKETAARARRVAGPGERREERAESANGTVPVNGVRVNHRDRRKPMTLDEALLEMEQDQDYLVYRDADKERVSVLVRRRDGHFDLIEG